MKSLREILERKIPERRIPERRIPERETPERETPERETPERETPENELHRPAGGCRLPVGRTLLLAILTNGLYWFHWNYRNRQLLEEHIGRKQHPVLHAVSQVIPVWNLVSFHETASAYNRLLKGRGIRGTVRINTAIFLMVLNTLCYLVTLTIAVTTIIALSAVTNYLQEPGLVLQAIIFLAGLSGIGNSAISMNNAVADFLDNPLLTAFLAGSLITQTWAGIQMLLLCWVQSGINTYWNEAYQDAGTARPTSGELATIMTGLLTWLVILSLWARV